MMITEDGRFTVFPKFGLFFVVVVVIVKKTVQQLGRDPSSGPTERSNPLRPAVWEGDEQKLVQKTQTIIWENTKPLDFQKLCNKQMNIVK